MGPHESPTRQPENQAPLRRKRSVRRPRIRRCLLKGCEERFHPRRTRQRYCSERCRLAAREWSRWKAQQKYRATAAGKIKRVTASGSINGIKHRGRKPFHNTLPPSGLRHDLAGSYGVFSILALVCGARLSYLCRRLRTRRNANRRIRIRIRSFGERGTCLYPVRGQ
jgi:hypothetical protein